MAEQPAKPSPMPAPVAVEPPAASERSALEESVALLPLLSLVPALRVLMGLGIAALVIAALYFGRELLIPIALATFLSFLLDPAVSRLKRWGLPRALAVALVSITALAALVGAGTYLTSQLRELSADLPAYQDTIRGKIKNLRSELGGPSSWDGAVQTFDAVQKQIESSAQKARVQQVEVVTPPPSSMKTAAQWLERVGGPIATAGIVLLFVILILLDRDSLRDRVLRLMGGGNLHLATDALQEATTRIGRYLRMQLIVNASYGVPMAVGLYFIGVPGAVLWGALATVMRFVPYVGPMISAVFPLALAFAVDPGWEMVLWTLGLIAVLELISNNIIEPWLYGASTGLSTLSIIAAATFWTALWGPIGLILSTPMTVCLLVLGRYVPALGFMEALLGTTAVLDLPQRLYQRLLAGDVEEASDMVSSYLDERLEEEANEAERSAALVAFHDEVGLPVLRLASTQHAENATAQHRLRLASGMRELLEDLQQDYPAPASIIQHPPTVHCLGARWEVDAFAATMAAHALRCAGFNARAHAPILGAAMIATLDLQPGDIVCVSIFHPQPENQLRQIARRLRRRAPQVKIIAAPWSEHADRTSDEQMTQAGIEGSASSMAGLMLRVAAVIHATTPVKMDVDDAAEQVRVATLLDSGVLDPAHYPLYSEAARQAANAFDTRYAQVSWIGHDEVIAPASLLPQPADRDGIAQGLPRAAAICSHVVAENGTLVIGDLERDPRMAALEVVKRHQLGFYAGVPLRVDGHIIGSLCILDDAPRTLDDAERKLLESMGEALMKKVIVST
jgi:predicted PurR-regulated permease PerM/GAF domain-containing protein